MRMRRKVNGRTSGVAAFHRLHQLSYDVTWRSNDEIQYNPVGYNYLNIESDHSRRAITNQSWREKLAFL